MAKTYTRLGHEKNTETHKWCTKCESLVAREDYGKNKGRHDGLSVYCKPCQRIKSSEEKKTEQYKKRRTQYMEIYREKNRDKMNEYAREWGQNNRDKRNQYGREANKLWMRNKRQNDPCFRLRCNISRNISFAFRASNSSKRGESVLKHLPYTKEQLKEHIQNQFDSNMSWDNYGSYWHLDHIVPQDALPYDSFDHPNFLKCWSLDNLRPLEAKENIRKGNKL